MNRQTENPYPGLRSFSSDEAHFFFGRDAQSDELLDRLKRHRFVAVVGRSGSGKSSLVKAGVLPSLLGGFMGEAGSVWRVAQMRPGSNPIGHLAEALPAPPAYGDEDEPGDKDDVGDKNELGEKKVRFAPEQFVETTLRRGPLGLIEAARQGGLVPGENLLVLVDQFEEIFRFRQVRGAEDDSAAFVKLLLEAADQEEVPIYVILTMRSDYLGDCANFRDLPEAMNNSQYLIPRMSRDDLRLAITGPSAVGGSKVSDRLLQRLLLEAGDAPEQLPVLQHLLWRIWELASQSPDGSSRQPRILDLKRYEEAGGMKEALSRHADEAFIKLDQDHRRIAEILFKRLTEKDPDHREVRRPRKIAEIMEVAEASEDEVVDVVKVFRGKGRSFLTSQGDEDLTAASVVDISHESLIWIWKGLRQWAADEAESAQRYRRLAESAAFHEVGQTDLLQGAELATTLEWRATEGPNQAWAERYGPNFKQAMEFLERSHLDLERSRRDAERKRRSRVLLTWISLLAVTVLVYELISAVLENREQRVFAEWIPNLITLVEGSEDRFDKEFQSTIAPFRGKPATAAIVTELAGSLEDRGDLRRAKLLYREALNIYQQTLGREDRAVPEALNNLAVTLVAQGEYGEAEKSYRESLEIRLRIYGRRSEQVARLLNNLSVLYQDSGDLEKAEPLARESLAIRLEIHGPDRPLVASSHNNLGFLLQLQGDFEAAEQEYLEALRILETLQLTLRRAYVLRNLAELYRKRGDLDEAEIRAREAQVILEDELTHWRIADADRVLGSVLLAQGKVREAEALIRPACERLVKAKGPNARQTRECDVALEDLEQRLEAAEGDESANS